MNKVLLVSLLAWGCTDRTREVQPVTFEQVEDVGVDVEDVAVPLTPDAYCEDALDGASCALPGAHGVCVREECVLVACESGFGDCGSADGCETSFAESEHCGGCDRACEPTQSCVSGPSGFVCAAGIACPPDTFDLDSDPQNGCEWSADWESSFALAPSELQIEAAGWGDDGLIVAGGVDDARISVSLQNTPQPTYWAEPRGAAIAVDVRKDAEFERVVWSDGVSLRRLSDQTTFFLEPPCEPATVPRRIVGATEEFVATQFEVLRVDTQCADGACLEPVFGVADYHGDVFAELDASEVEACDVCVLSLPAGCWGTQCRAPDFDDTECAACETAGCPVLQIVDLVGRPSGLTVVTSRGIVVVDDAGDVVDRRESRFDPAVAGGPRFVAGLAAPSNVTLVHSTGFLRVLDDELLPRFPDFGIPFDPEVAQLAGFGDAVFAVDEDGLRMIRPGDVSGRTVFVDLTTAPGIQGLRAFVPLQTPDGMRVIYAAAGLVYTRLFTQP